MSEQKTEKRCSRAREARGNKQGDGGRVFVAARARGNPARAKRCFACDSTGRTFPSVNPLSRATAQPGLSSDGRLGEMAPQGGGGSALCRPVTAALAELCCAPGHIYTVSAPANRPVEHYGADYPRHPCFYGRIDPRLFGELDAPFRYDVRNDDRSGPRHLNRVNLALRRHSRDLKREAAVLRGGSGRSLEFPNCECARVTRRRRTIRVELQRGPADPLRDRWFESVPPAGSQ